MSGFWCMCKVEDAVVGRKYAGGYIVKVSEKPPIRKDVAWTYGKLEGIIMDPGLYTHVMLKFVKLK